MQSFPFNATNQFIGFSVNTYDRWSNPSTNEYDIFVDVNNDNIDDYIVMGVNQGAVQTGTFNGRLGSFVFSTRSAGASITSSRRRRRTARRRTSSSSRASSAVPASRA